MNERERVEGVRAFLKFNKKTFSEVLGYTYSQQYTKYLNGTTSLSIKAIKSLIEYDNRFNINWILTGQGEMFLNSPKIINGDNNNTQVGDFNNSDNSNNKNISVNSNNKEIEYLQSKIELLEQSLKDKDERLKDKERLISMLEKNQK